MAKAKDHAPLILGKNFDRAENVNSDNDDYKRSESETELHGNSPF
jgi:hypothetical protein